MSQQARHERNLQRAAATPRFSTLTICVRGALRGWNDRVVQHMIERNREIEMQRAMLAMGAEKMRAILRARTGRETIGASA